MAHALLHAEGLLSLAGWSNADLQKSLGRHSKTTFKSTDFLKSQFFGSQELRVSCMVSEHYMGKLRRRRGDRVKVDCTLAGDFMKEFKFLQELLDASAQKLSTNRSNGSAHNQSTSLNAKASVSDFQTGTTASSLTSDVDHLHTQCVASTGSSQNMMGRVIANDAASLASGISTVGLGEVWPGTVPGPLQEPMVNGRTRGTYGRVGNDSYDRYNGNVRGGSPGDFAVDCLKLDSSSRIAIIGSGVSGIAACKALTEAGFSVTVFETKDRVGGIWSRTYPTTSLQTPRTAYRFSEWDWPADAPSHPSHDEVVRYVEGYVEHFGLREKIWFKTRVASLQRPEGGRRGWVLKVQSAGTRPDGTSGPIEERMEHFDFVVNCCGCFGDVPSFPKFKRGEGPEVFTGKVMHSAEYSGLGSEGCSKLLKDKHVVVVGFQKTAIDVAIEAAAANGGPDGKPCTLLFRKPHWFVPRKQRIWGIPLKYMTLTRFAELFHRRPGQNLLLTVLQTALPLRDVMSRVVEAYLCQTYPLGQHNLVPTHSFIEDLAACILPQMPASFFPLVEEGRIQLSRSPKWRFTPAGVELADGRQLSADVVLLCTGYDSLGKLKGLLPPSYASQLSENGQSLYLYRGVIHPRVPHMAFLGFHEGASSVHTSEMGARWLAKLLQGSFSLPSPAAMEAECRQWWELKQLQSPYAGRVSCVVPIHSWHFDRLCRDMGWNPRRKKTLLAHWFSPHSSADYAESEEDKEAAKSPAKKGAEEGAALDETTLA